MVSNTIVPSMPATEASDQTNELENGCSPTTTITDTATDVETRLASARARREYDVTERANPRTIEHIRQLIALECTRVERMPANGACAKMCGSQYCDTFGCMLDQSPPLEGDRAPVCEQEVAS